MPPKKQALKTPAKPTHRKKGWKRVEDRLPKVIENPKKAIFIMGRNSSQTLKTALNDLAQYKKPYCVKLTQKHDILPFEDDAPLETYSKSRDCSLFLFGSHTKKRPNTLTFVRSVPVV